jgi:hypothetical protein
MRDRIAKNAQANRRIEIAADGGPIFKIGERVAISSRIIFFHATA